jgi:hypothetical protein
MVLVLEEKEGDLPPDGFGGVAGLAGSQREQALSGLGAGAALISLGLCTVV